MTPKGLATLTYAVRPRIVLKYFGQLCQTMVILAGVPAVVAVAFGEYAYAWRFVAVALFCLVCGGLLGRLRAASPVLAGEALAVIALTFVAAAAFMSWPLAASGLPYLDVLFESVSGITTTGLSTVADIEAQSPTFHFTRAWLQWYGGLAIVALSVALTFEAGHIRDRVAESALGTEDIVTGTRVRARRMLIVFGILTAAGFLLLLLVGVAPYDALVHTLAAVSTGGFSPHADSLAGLGSYAARAIVIALATTGAVSFTLYFRAWRDGWRALVFDRELWTLLACAGVGTLLLAACLSAAGGRSWQEIVRHAPLLAFSAQTTAGFTPVDVGRLDAASHTALIVMMFIGGDSGSTAGGIKVLRLLIVWRLLCLLVQRPSVAPHAVLDVRVLGRTIDDAQLQAAVSVVLLYVVVILASVFPFLLLRYDPLHALFEVVSATGTVGLSTGVTAPGLHPLLKIILCGDMLMGRLEVVALLVVLRPATWFGQRISTA